MPSRARREAPSAETATDATVTPINRDQGAQQGQREFRPEKFYTGTVVSRPRAGEANVRGETKSTAKFRIEAEERGETKRYNVNAWEALAEQTVNAELEPGDKVKIRGRITRDGGESFTRDDGSSGTSLPDIKANSIGVEVQGKFVGVDQFDRSMLTAPVLETGGLADAGGMSAAD